MMIFRTMAVILLASAFIAYVAVGEDRFFRTLDILESAAYDAVRSVIRL